MHVLSTSSACASEIKPFGESCKALRRRGCAMYAPYPVAMEGAEKVVPCRSTKARNLHAHIY